MTVITKDQSCNKNLVVSDEAEKLQRLIDRRHAWLAKPENKMKSTFSAVLADTREMEAELQSLENSIEV